MAQIKGQTGNPFGRKRGVKNRVSNETKKLIAAFMDEKFIEVERAWDNLTPLEKVKTYISLVKYIMPTMASIRVEEDNNDDVLKKFLANQK